MSITNIITTLQYIKKKIYILLNIFLNKIKMSGNENPRAYESRENQNKILTGV